MRVRCRNIYNENIETFQVCACSFRHPAFQCCYKLCCAACAVDSSARCHYRAVNANTWPGRGSKRCEKYLVGMDESVSHVVIECEGYR